MSRAYTTPRSHKLLSATDMTCDRPTQPFDRGKMCVCVCVCATRAMVTGGEGKEGKKDKIKTHVHAPRRRADEECDLARRDDGP